MSAPYEILRTIDKMNVERKTEFIVNDCHCKYVPASKMLFDSFTGFIYNTYVKYRKETDGELSV